MKCHFFTPTGLHGAWHGTLGWQAPAGIAARLVINTSREGHPWKSVMSPGNHPAAQLIRHLAKVILLGDQRIITTSFYNLFFFSSLPKAPDSSNNLERCLGMPNNKMHFRSGFIINVCIIYLSWKDYSD